MADLKEKAKKIKKKGKIEIVDQCLAPDKFIYLTYKGPNPWGVSKKISGMIRPHFHISSSSVYNTRVNWDVVGENISFFSHWRVKRALSRFSQMWATIKIVGWKNKATNNGEFSLTMDADLKTSFSGWTVTLKPLYYLYSYLFYYRYRRNLLEFCRNSMYEFRNEIKRHYNLDSTEIPKAYGVFG